MARGRNCHMAREIDKILVGINFLPKCYSRYFYIYQGHGKKGGEVKVELVLLLQFGKTRGITPSKILGAIEMFLAIGVRSAF